MSRNWSEPAHILNIGDWLFSWPGRFTTVPIWQKATIKTDLFPVVKIIRLYETEPQMSSQYSCRYSHVLRIYKYRVTKKYRDTRRIPLTTRSRVLLAKLVVPQLVKIFPAFRRNGRSITLFTRSHHLSLSWADQALPFYFLTIHFNIILHHRCEDIKSYLNH
jgi:hypothetical protein